MASPRSFVRLAAINATQTGLNLMTGILVARALGPSLRGELASITIIATVTGTILPLGFPQALVTWRGSVRMLRWTLVGHAVAAAVIGGNVFVVVALLSGSPVSWWRILAGSLISAGGTYAALATGISQRLGDFGLLFRAIRLLPATLSVGYMAVLWYSGVTSLFVWLACAAAVLFGPTSVLYGVLLARAEGQPADEHGEDRRTFLGLAVGSALTVLGAQLLYRIDSIVVAVSLAHDQIAYYAVAFGAQGACLSVAQAGSMLAFSDLGRAVDRKTRRAALRRSLLPTAALSMCLAAAAIIAAPLVVPLAYGREFVDAVAVTRVLVAAAVPLSLDYVFLHVLIVERAQRSTFLLQMTLLVGGAVGLAAVASRGPTDIALAMLCLVSMSCVVNGVRVFRRLNGDVCEFGRGHAA